MVTFGRLMRHTGVNGLAGFIAAIAMTVVLAAGETSTPSPTPAPSLSVAPPLDPSPVHPSAAPGTSPSASAAPRPTATPAPSVVDLGPGSRAAAPIVVPKVQGHATRLADGTVLVVGEDACVTVGAVRGSERTELY